MASATLRSFTKDFPTYFKIHLQHIRHRHFLRGKPPTVALSLKQRLAALKQTDPTTSFQVNIGFSVPKVALKRKQEWLSEQKARWSDGNFDKVPVDLVEARKVWLETSFPLHVREIANHYGIFQDLFGDAFFLPVVPLDINYKINDDTFARVYTGNVVKPVEAAESPEIKYQAGKDSLWTLVMCTPDGNLEDSSREYCHWFLGNIPENRIDLADQIIDYMRPIPAKGAGYYRYIYVLYKQNKRLDYAEYKKPQPCLQLQERNWSTLEFYRKHQDHLTPAGLAFFQSNWDSTVKEFYHSALGASEPIFQYDFPKPPLNPQKWFPLKQPFNLYLDRYRDPKEIAKEFLVKKLKTVHPFKEPSTPLKYPNASRIDADVPSWLKEEISKERLGYGRVNDIK